MNLNHFAEDVRQQLRSDGYDVHQGDAQADPELAGAWWYTWMKPGMADAEVGPTVASEWAAWASALTHRLAESTIVLDRVEDTNEPEMGPFHPASLPDSALDATALAARMGVTREVAQQQVERLRRQSVFVNDRYQVNVEAVGAPFGPQVGEMMWLSIKRRDRLPVHDWRELQAIKNRLVGDEHEAFEVYPSESRLVDTANQYHLWVFVDPRVRLPVGFREREVMDADAAAAQGATQRPFAAAPVGEGLSANSTASV